MSQSCERAMLTISRLKDLYTFFAWTCLWGMIEDAAWRQYTSGGAENAGRENDGREIGEPICRAWNSRTWNWTNAQSMILQKVKMTDQITGHENEGHEIPGHKRARCETVSEAANVWGWIDWVDLAFLLCSLWLLSIYYSVVGLKICTLHCNVISVKTVLLPQFQALSSFLVRHVHVLHFHVLQFHVLQFHVLQIGPSLSRPAISRPAHLSINFMSCNFMPCNFDGPSFSRPAFS